jgi:regulator of sigma E protease
MMGWFISLLVLSLLIFFHELGHFLAARAMGVYVKVFSIGFGKKLASFQWKDTEWRIAMIPLGGYVQMKGQEDLDPTALSTDEDSYNVKKPWQRIFILLAGPFANFLLAYFLFWFIALGGPQVLSPVVGEVMKDSPAEKAGLKTNDIISEINGVKVETWQDMAEDIAASSGSINFLIERGGYIQNITITPQMREARNDFNETIQRRMIGIGAAGVSTTLKVENSLGYAWEKTIWSSTLIFGGLKRLILGDVPAKELGGVISIVKVTADATSNGWMAVLFFAALISVNLGVLNLLPIPALDGGHIMFNLYEMLFGKPPSEEVLVRLTIGGWAILIGLMSLGLYNDINRLIG